MKETYDDLKISNDFMFAKVMRNKRLCKKLLEVILGIEIEKIEYPEEQKTIDLSMDARSVRLDVYVKDDKETIYNVEMQTINTRNLPKRSRYYQGMIDLNLIEKGEDFNKLNKSYVIFICLEDIFKEGRCVYSFENLCIQDTSIHLNFLKYLAEGKPIDCFTKQLEEEVVKAKENEEWRREYMTLMMRDREKYEEGHEAGFTEGEALLGNLMSRLIADGRIEDVELAATDKDARKRLYKEYGLIQ